METLIATKADIHQFNDLFFFKRKGYKKVKINKTIVKDIEYGNLVTIQTKKS